MIMIILMANLTMRYRNIFIRWILYWMEDQISGISINSRGQPHSNLKDKEVSSTLQDSQVLQLDSLHSVPTHPSIDSRQSQAIKQILKKIANVQNSQKELAAKFEKVKQNLMNQIDKKDELNFQLQKQIGQLRTEVQQGKKDLEIISSYISKKTNKQDKTDTIKLKNSLNKNNTTDKHLLSSKKPIEDRSRQEKRQKITSLRGQVLKKF